MKTKLNGDLVIETTRRCNLECVHCLRGQQENVFINHDFMENAIKQFNYINTITFTGGEPGLNPKAINEFIYLCKKHNVGVGSFYIATNGTVAPDAYIKALTNLYLFCEDNEMSAVNISNDEFHELEDFAVNKLMLFRFTDMKYNDNYKPDRKYMLNEGYFFDNYNEGRDVTPESFKEIDKEELESDGTFQDLTLYLNCNGKIILGCNWSYQNQEDHVLCKSNDNILETILNN